MNIVLSLALLAVESMLRRGSASSAKRRAYERRRSQHSKYANLEKLLLARAILSTTYTNDGEKLHRLTRLIMGGDHLEETSYE